MGRLENKRYTNCATEISKLVVTNRSAFPGALLNIKYRVVVWNGGSATRNNT